MTNQSNKYCLSSFSLFICQLSLLLCSGIIIITAMMLPSVNTAAKQFNLSLDGNSPILVDNAGIYNDYEEVTIINQLKERRDTDGYLYIFLTTSDVSEFGLGHELEEIYDDYYEWVRAEGTVLFLISTDENHRFCELQGYGGAADIIPHDICSQINNDVNSKLENDDYMAIATTLFSDLDSVNAGNIVSYETTRNHLPQTVLAAFISLIAAILISAMCVFTRTTSHKPVRNVSVRESSVKIRHLAKQDTYIRSTIRKYDV